MIKTTTLETSKEVARVLKDAGIELETEKGWIEGSFESPDRPIIVLFRDYYGVTPAYTLGELMEVVPDKLVVNIYMYRPKPYVEIYDRRGSFDAVGDTLEEAVAKAIIWLGDNGYLKG